MTKAWQRMKRIALAVFRRKPRREMSVVINGQQFKSKDAA